MASRILNGVIVSSKTPKTVIVEVKRTVTHPVFKKQVTLSKNFPAHDEEGLYHGKEGENVSIGPCRPMSRTKRYQIISKKTD